MFVDLLEDAIKSLGGSTHGRPLILFEASGAT